MGVSLQELVQTPALGLKVLVHGRGLNQPISWAHISDLADPSRFLDGGGELLLTRGVWVTGPCDPFDYCRRLIEAQVVGLGFSVGGIFEEVPPQVVEAARQNGLPLLVVPKETAFISVTKRVAASLAQDQIAEVSRALAAQKRLYRVANAATAAGPVLDELGRSLRTRTEVIDALERESAVGPVGARPERRLQKEIGRLMQHLSDKPELGTVGASCPEGGVLVSHLRARDRSLGFLAAGRAEPFSPQERDLFDFGAELLTAVLMGNEELLTLESSIRRYILGLLTHADAQRADELALECLDERLPRRGRVHLFEGSLSVVSLKLLGQIVREYRAGSFFAPIDNGVLIYGTQGDELIRRVVRELWGRPGVPCGVSDLVPLRDFAIARQQADVALSNSKSNGASLVYYSDVQAFSISDYLPPALRAQFTAQVLRPLCGEESRRRNDLIASLYIWLAYHGQWDPAASALGVHRHTLHKRMERVEVLLGRPLNSMTTRMELWLALQGLLEAPGSVSTLVPDLEQDLVALVARIRALGWELAQ